MKKIIMANLLIALTLAGCSTTPDSTQKNLYSKDETARLTYCVGLSDIAFYAAQKKLDGMGIEEVKAKYASAKNTEIIYSVIDVVYSEEFTSSYSYQKSFFHDCGIKLAEVDASRMQSADFCNHNQFLAGVVHSMKENGNSREQTLAKLKAKEGDITTSIVNAVYSVSGTRSEIKLDIWKLCLDSVAKK